MCRNREYCQNLKIIVKNNKELNIIQDMEYIYLFFISFLSATIFPFGSEAIFLYDISIGLNVVGLLTVATFGNTFGSYINYWLGLKGEEYLIKKAFIKEQQLTKAKRIFNKYGAISLLFSWLPIVGDTFTFVAGVLKYDRFKFIFIVAIAKFGRYLFLVLGYHYFS